uniref:Uncharacterized protein n=1 Tax=Romanomermis culicivorax TaxID=13658 RepID=A0A915IRP6_ROMCU
MPNNVAVGPQVVEINERDPVDNDRAGPSKKERSPANAFTIHVDESTDISKTKLLLLYTQHFDCLEK